MANGEKYALPDKVAAKNTPVSISIKDVYFGKLCRIANNDDE